MESVGYWEQTPLTKVTDDMNALHNHPNCHDYLISSICKSHTIIRSKLPEDLHDGSESIILRWLNRKGAGCFCSLDH